MEFRASDYGIEVERLLALDGDGKRAMPLVTGGCLAPGARAELRVHTARELFPDAVSAEGAMAGLHLYFGCFEEAHTLAQDLDTVEGSFWHGIVHRQEPDAGNAGYWFRRVGQHATFPALRDAAGGLGYATGAAWDPFAFIQFCESARALPGSNERPGREGLPPRQVDATALAMRIQLVEWQLLFDFCARRKAH